MLYFDHVLLARQRRERTLSRVREDQSPPCQRGVVSFLVPFSAVDQGFGYVTFEEKDGLLRALDMGQAEIGGRRIRVEVARPQNNRGGGSRRGETHTALLAFLVSGPTCCYQ